MMSDKRVTSHERVLNLADLGTRDSQLGTRLKFSRC